MNTCNASSDARASATDKLYQTLGKHLFRVEGPTGTDSKCSVTFLTCCCYHYCMKEVELVSSSLNPNQTCSSVKRVLTPRSCDGYKTCLFYSKYYSDLVSLLLLRCR